MLLVKFMPNIDWQELVEKYRFQIAIFLAGLIALGVGILLSNGALLKKTNVTILESATEAQGPKEIVVEIAGSVESPGVYKLASGSRVEDLLIAGGGVSENADRVWMEKSLNRAAKLTDGQKIYIPQQSEVLSANVSTAGLGIENAGGVGLQKTININAATLSELETLWGIGPAYGQKIIEGRPYSDTSELLSRKIIPQKTFEKIKNQISVY